MIIGIDPKIDYAFKRVFGREQNRDILIALLNAVLQPPEDLAVVSVEILNPFNDKETADDKLSIVDVRARDGRGRHFNVEMQMLADKYFTRRLLYYWSRLYAQQLQEADPYELLRPTISICFVNSVRFPEFPEHHLRFRLADETHGVLFNEDLDLHILELPKFTRTAAELTTPLEAWLYFLRHADDVDLAALPAPLAAKNIRRALEELQVIKQNEVDRERYEARVKLQRDAISRELAAQQEGLEKGIEQGLQLGREQGVRLGKAAELIRRIHLCQRLLKQPLTSEEELRRLTIEEQEQLADKLEHALTDAGPK
jgi:predicted transposase/invertase (TIGR01784 family)